MQLSGNGALADLLCGRSRPNWKIKRVRGDTFGYLQRSFIGCVSDVDQREAREVGEGAVTPCGANVDGSVAIKRTGFLFGGATELACALERGRPTRTMDDSSSPPAAPT